MCTFVLLHNIRVLHKLSLTAFYFDTGMSFIHRKFLIHTWNVKIEYFSVPIFMHNKGDSTSFKPSYLPMLLCIPDYAQSAARASVHVYVN